MQTVSYYKPNIFISMKKLHNQKPLKFGHVLSLLHLFADDNCIFLEYNRGNLLHLEKLFDQVELEIGLKINYDNIEILCVDSIGNSDCILITQKVTHGLKILLEC